MARDNDKGLYLPLRVDLSDWEKDLLRADVDLQKAMREMRSQVDDMKLQYDVKIAGARAAGNDIKALELENQRLNAIYDAQKQAVEALNRAYEKSVQEKGADAQASKALATQLVRESNAMERTRKQIEAQGLNLGKSISDGLANISPEFAKVRTAVAGVTSTMTKMGSTAAKAAKAVSGIGIAVATLGVAYTGLEAITNAVNDIATAGRDASDPIYQLRESLQSTYEDAEYLWRVTAIDGSNAESLANSLVKLDAALKKDTDGTSLASQALRRYGAELFTAYGKLKDYKAQLQELSKAAQLAASVGEYADFKASLPGAFRTTEFDHLLLGLQNYETLAKNAASATKVYYDELHKVSDWQNTVAEAQRNLDAIKGGFFAQASVKNLQNEVDTLKATAIVLKQNEAEYEKLGVKLGEITDAWTDFKGSATIAWESVKSDIAGGIKKLEEYEKIAKYVFALNPANLVGGAVLDYFKEKYDQAKKQLDTVKTDVKKEREDNEKQAQEAEKNKNLGTVNKEVPLTEKKDNKEKQKAEQEEKRRLDAQRRLEKELRDIQATEYQREIYALQDKIQAYRDEGVAEVEANKLYNAEKERIDKKYYEKLQAERQKSAQQAEAAYKKEAEMAKQAREANISDAEQTLRNNLKLIRYIQNEQKKGTYTEENAKEYANKLYMRQNGFRQSDIDALKTVGVDTLKQVADARSRIFADFANIQAPTQPAGNTVTNNVTNNNTVQFDNTVVEDIGTMEKLANKVAEIIIPQIEQALNGTSQYGY